jgi:hypothetical protein
MRILIAALHSPAGKRPIGGVQSWSTTVGAVLRARGHQVMQWGPDLGPTFEKFDKFDCGIFANWIYTAPAERAIKPIGRILRVSHGIVPAEQGGEVFTSEDVRQHWGGTGSVIRQPINVEFWTPPLFTDRDRRLGVFFSYRSMPAGLPDALRLEGFDRIVHVRDWKPAAVREVLQHAGVVVASGRALLEAMSCGAPVVLADSRTYQGVLLDPNPTNAARFNYSGRGGIKNPGVDDFRLAIRRALEHGSVRAHVLMNHHDESIVDHISDELGLWARSR